MKAISLLVLCCFSSSQRVHGEDQLHAQSHDVIRSLEDLKQHVATLEQLLQDQGSRLSLQERTIQDQSARLLLQERTIQDQGARLLLQERTLQDQSARLLLQERTLQDQNARLSRQEETVVTQQGLSNRQRSEFIARVRQQDETIQQQREDLDQLKGTCTGRWGLGKNQVERQSEDTTYPEKRSDDAGTLEAVISGVTQQVTEMTSDIQALQNANERQDEERGTSYIRWGHTACPGSSELVYTGVVAGTRHGDAGGAGNHLCLTSSPVSDGHAQPSGNGYASIYGSEYQNCPEPECDTTPACAVCRVTRAATVMIPGTNTCSPGWTPEYSGYIMAGSNAYSGSSEFICVDSRHAHHAQSSQAHHSQNTIYYTHVKCGALPCPPYQDNTILTCIVCSK